MHLLDLSSGRERAQDKNRSTPVAARAVWDPGLLAFAMAATGP